MSFAALALPLFLASSTELSEASTHVPEPSPIATTRPEESKRPTSPAAPASIAHPTMSTPPVAREASPKANVIFVELLGNGLLYSVNYERFIERWRVGLRAGASFFTYGVSSYGSSGNLTIVTFPLVASYYVSWRSHKIQLGLGATVIHTQVATDSRGTRYEGERAGTGIAPTGFVGYRYVPVQGGLSFGVGFTPLYRYGKFLPWGGAAVGWTF